MVIISTKYIDLHNCDCQYYNYYFCYANRVIADFQPNSTATNPGCHGNEIWVKIGYNSAYMKDITIILASNMGFRGRAI